MQKQVWTWETARLPYPARLARWGHFGTPVLIFPTAGGDFEEIERFQLVAALGGLIEAGRIKVYSVDAVAQRARLAANTSSRECASLQEHSDSFLYEDVLQRIRSDCQNDQIEPFLVGASLGAAAAVSTLCRHPESFRVAIGLSGVYDEVAIPTGPQLARLRQRAVILGCGAGDYENPAASRQMADALGSHGIGCRLELWGPTRGHSWSTWRDSLPALLQGQL
jgi:esterase/lipase superfamily enzyme